MSPFPADLDSRTRLLWILIWALALLALTLGIGTTALMEPDEGRNAEVGREMAVGGDYIVPHLNGLPYLDKPVFFFAAVALSIDVLGPTELAARLPALVFTLATVVLVIAFGWRRFGPGTALAAGLMLATSPLVMAFARIVIFDAVMMFWVALACIAFYRSWERQALGWCLLAWSATGIAVLTKGPVGLLLPLLVMVPTALATGRPLRALFHPAGIGLFLVLCLSWFLAVVARHPEFPHYAFVRETLERVATDRLKRTGPVYYFLPLLLGGGFPWVLPLLSLRRLIGYWRERLGGCRDEVFLLLWCLLPILFFSLSQSKRPGYVLPVFPALALLAARLLAESPTLRRATAWATGLAGTAAGLAFLLGSERLASALESTPGIAAAVSAQVPLLGIALLLAAMLAFFAAHRGAQAAVTLLALTPIALLLGLNGVVQAVGEYRSARSMSQTLDAAAPAGVRIVGVDALPPSLPYYRRQPIPLASEDANALRSNYIADYQHALRDYPGGMLRPRDWWREVLASCVQPTVFVLRADEARERSALVAAGLPLLAASDDYVIYGPCHGPGR